MLEHVWMAKVKTLRAVWFHPCKTRESAKSWCESTLSEMEQFSFKGIAWQDDENKSYASLEDYGYASMECFLAEVYP